jgi:hypothetical protein
MAEPKTRPTKASVPAFIKAVPTPAIREASATISEIMTTATGAPPVMWGTGIVGFGTYQATYASGKTVDWMLTGFAPRKNQVTLYMLGGFPAFEELLGKLGPHKKSGGCLHLKSLEGIHLPTLKKMVKTSVQHRKKANPPSTGKTT